MALIVGTLVVLISVASGFVLLQGQLMALWQPYELIIIGGAALGAFIIANPGRVVSAVLRGVPGLLVRSRYNKKTCLELLAMMHQVFDKTRQDGMMAIETDIDDPRSSDIFTRYPKIMKNRVLMEFVTDYLRIMAGGNMNPFELENLMDIEMETRHREKHAPAEALRKVASGLPGFGIIAAILVGVIALGTVSGSAGEISTQVAAALVGVGFGLLIAYGFVAPVAQALTHKSNEEARVLECIKVCLLATVNGYNPNVAVEFGRKTLFTSDRPGYEELDNRLKQDRHSSP